MSGNLRRKTLACIGGAGKIGSAIVNGLLAAREVTPAQLIVTARHEQSLAPWKKERVRTTRDNRSAIRQAHIVLLCVHPEDLPALLKDIGPRFSKTQLVISIVSGCSTATIEHYAEHPVHIIRAMPNTPVRVGAAMTCLAAGRHASRGDLALAESIFRTVGVVEVLDERHMDAATGLGGCGPAFAFKIIEALSEGGVKMGLPRHVARKMAAQVLKGAAELVLTSGQHPAELKDAVTTPGGCTIDGLTRLEERGLSIALIDAVETATRKSRELLPKG